MKDVKSILLMLLSVLLIGTWVYHLYDKSVYSQRKTEVMVRDSAAVADAVRDSLHALYTSRINQMNAQLDSSSIKTDSLQRYSRSLSSDLQERLKEIQRLRQEIRRLLQTCSNNPKEIETARVKIKELQDQIDQLQSNNSGLTTEASRLNNLVTDLNRELLGMREQLTTLQQENVALNSKMNESGSLIASDFKVEAVDIRGSKEKNTNKAKKANAFNGSFTVQNKINNFDKTDVYIKILQPDSSVLHIPNTDVSAITKALTVDYAKGEQKQIEFSIPTPDLSPGQYIIEIWHNGFLAGKTVKMLE